MNKTRLEAFSDGVLAIIITIMVLEIKMPHSADWDSLLALHSVFICYALSFAFVGIYWGNHHHLVHTVKVVSPGIIWANMHLLFWLSLIPLATNWMGENHFARNTVILYAVLLLLCGISYTLLQTTIEKSNELSHELKEAFAAVKRKGIVSVICYSCSIPLAFVHTAISGCLFAAVAIMWIIPERNIAKALKD